MVNNVRCEKAVLYYSMFKVIFKSNIIFSDIFLHIEKTNDL